MLIRHPSCCFVAFTFIQSHGCVLSYFHISICFRPSLFIHVQYCNVTNINVPLFPCIFRHGLISRFGEENLPKSSTQNLRMRILNDALLQRLRTKILWSSSPEGSAVLFQMITNKNAKLYGVSVCTTNNMYTEMRSPLHRDHLRLHDWPWPWGFQYHQTRHDPQTKTDLGSEHPPLLKESAI